MTVTASTTSRLCISENSRVSLVTLARDKARLTGSGSVKVSDDMGHTSLVAHESGKMNRLGRIIL